MEWNVLKNHSWYIKSKELFRQGLSPWEMALSIALGAYLGVIPVLGVATPVITFLALYLRLNLPLALFVTYAVSPLHLALFLPFIWVGEWILGVEHLVITWESVRSAFREDMWLALVHYSYHLWYGIIGWIVVGGPLAIVLHFVIFTWTKYFKKA